MYNSDNHWKGSFTAYKNFEDSSFNNGKKKVNRTHNIDNLFLISYTEAGLTTENAYIDKNEATSNFTEVYPTKNDSESENLTKHLKYKYKADNSIDSSAAAWWLCSASSYKTQAVATITSTGNNNENSANYTLRLAPACTLY